jgi:hypothetical protein
MHPPISVAVFGSVTHIIDGQKAYTMCFTERNIMADLRTFNIPIALLNRVSVNDIVVANVTTASKTNPAMPHPICHATTKLNT